MLTEVFAEVYEKFKLNLYKHMFVNGGGKEHELTATETFTLEVIHAMKNPKVSQLAEFLEMSTPNVAYKISSLMKKGYIEKIQSKEDKREYILKETEKFHEYYKAKNSYIPIVLDRLAKRFTDEEIDNLEHILKVMSDEFMGEVNRFIADNKVD